MILRPQSRCMGSPNWMCSPTTVYRRGVTRGLMSDRSGTAPLVQMIGGLIGIVVPVVMVLPYRSGQP